MQKKYYLITFETVEKCYTYNGCTNSRMMCQRRENSGLHFNVYDTETVQLVQIFHFIVFSKITECTVQATLTCYLKLEISE